MIKSSLKNSRTKLSQVANPNRVLRQNTHSDLVPVLIHVTPKQLAGATVLAKDLKMADAAEYLGSRSTESFGPDGEDAYGYDTREYKNFMRKYGD
jgi:hypothetical protein